MTGQPCKRWPRSMILSCLDGTSMGSKGHAQGSARASLFQFRRQLLDAAMRMTYVAVPLPTRYLKASSGSGSTKVDALSPAISCSDDK